jgi:hypothetical protein
MTAEDVMRIHMRGPWVLIFRGSPWLRGLG